MNKEIIKKNKKERRKGRVRFKVSGVTSRPRFCVFKSNKGMFLQLIDDTKGVTLVSVNVKEVKVKGDKTSSGFEMGKLLAKKALDKKIETVVFDRGGNKYHGRVKAVADGAREGGLKF
jgi:large subunit ribosomal protein L18